MAEGVSYSGWSTEELIEKIKANEYYVAYCQRQIEDYEERIMVLSGSTREQDKMKKMKYEERLRNNKSIIARVEDEIIRCEQVLGVRVDGFEKTMQKSVDRLESKSLIVGGGGVGKSHLVAVSLKRKPPPLRISTPCAVVPPFLLKHVLICQGTVSSKVLTDEMYTKMMMKSGKEDDSNLSSDKVMLADPFTKVHPASHIPSFTQVEQHLLDSHRELEYVESLDGKVLGRIIDIGGQPQLLEILPRFISGTSLGVVVTDLSQDLADYSISYFYGEDGKSVGKGVKSNLTNEQIIRVFLQMIVSQSNEQKKVKIMIVGTHRDVEHKSKETRCKKEKKLKNIIATFGLDENVIYTDETHTNVIFAVNALHPEDQDHAIGQKIMEETLNEKNAERISIAIKHHNLELTLKMLSKSNRLSISFEEVFQHMSRHYLNYNAMKEGLVILHQSFRIFYFLDLPDLVFGEPQLLLNFFTTITVRHIKLTTNPDQAATSTGAWKQFKEQGIVTEHILLEIANVFDKTFTPRYMLEVMEKLFITCKVGDGKYLMPSLLTALACLPRSRPKLWLRWLPFGFGNYLSDLITGLKSDVTMLLHFPLGLVRYGVYCGTVCELITMYKWKLTGTASRNKFCFTRPHSVGTITLIDSFDSFFVVNLDIPSSFSSKSLPSICSDVRDILFNIIKKVAEELRYVADQPVVAFICEHHHQQTPHAAEYIRSGSYLLCTKDSNIVNEVKDKYLLWLDNLPAESNATLKFDPAAPNLPAEINVTLNFDSVEPNAGDCCHTIAAQHDRLPPSISAASKDTNVYPFTMDKLTLLKWTDNEHQVCQLFLINEMSPDWKRVSDLLGLTPTHTRTIEMNNYTVQDRCREVITEWINHEDGAYNYSRSWEGLYQLLNDMELATLANNLHKIVF